MKKFFKFSLLLALPLMAAAAIVWNVAAIPGERTDTVLLPDPEDCSRFFSCTNGVPILLHCPDGLYFNDLYDVCDWPTNVKCLIDTITGKGMEGYSEKCTYETMEEACSIPLIRINGYFRCNGIIIKRRVTKEGNMMMCKTSQNPDNRCISSECN